MKIGAKESFASGYDAGYAAMTAMIEEADEARAEGKTFTTRSLAIDVPAAEGETDQARILVEAWKVGVRYGCAQAKLDTGDDSMFALVESDGITPTGDES